MICLFNLKESFIYFSKCLLFSDFGDEFLRLGCIVFILIKSLLLYLFGERQGIIFCGGKVFDFEVFLLEEGRVFFFQVGIENVRKVSELIFFFSE